MIPKVLKQQHAVRDHMLDCDRVVKPDDFVLMTGDNSDYLLQIKENLFIGRDDRSSYVIMAVVQLKACKLFK